MSLPRIAHVAPGESPLTLRVEWRDGNRHTLDISGIVNSFRFYEPLRRDAVLFGKVHVGEYGTDIVWTGDLDMSADTLWRLAQEQARSTRAA